MDTLAADVNRTGIQTLSVPDAFETDGSFTVELRNHGEATHVHLHLDDALSSVAELDAGNHYVEADATRPVRVSVRDGDREETVRGKLKVVTAYGSNTHWVDVTLTPTRKQPVEVDPELSKPQAKPASAGDGGTPLDRSALLSALPAVVLSAVAVVFALAAVLGPGGTDAVLAVLAVVAGALAAGYIAFQ
ncbi:hypothetical protein N0B31_03875 [Salinirubellus salinus]|uniref:Uncharacterized protein n=1 Tax=Salinirubellus salinus TaxID=1364945 RepID=A0A9E7U912_9EURY|nr:hypothetical protein [Salinirubellus salinus]UWM55426.1 hypothetical protein N0B31_03875 [Salinirubellus salinus]